MKGEERVCHVTEADAPGANALDVSEEVSSCEAAVCHGPPPSRGLPPLKRGELGFCPCARRFCAAEQTFRRGSSASKGIWWMPWH